MKTLDEAFDEAWGLLHDEDGWKEEKTEKDAVVCSKKSKKGKKILDTLLCLQFCRAFYPKQIWRQNSKQFFQERKCIALRLSLMLHPKN